LEEKRKSRSPVQQINNTKHGVTWKVETRASLRHQQEQMTQEVASWEQTKKTRLEISCLEQEVKVLKEKLHSARPETPLTDKEKQDIIKSLIQSFKITTTPLITN
jgi:seryl-tRNA synthetase